MDKWVISDFVFRRLVPIVGITPFSLDELMLMTATVCYFKPQYIFEWGTHIGKSARIFFEISKTFHIGSQVNSIDLPDDVNHIEHPHSERGRFVKHIVEIKLYQGDGVTKSIELYKNYQTENPVLFFVDGDHTYESVINELDTINKHVNNANILLHDTFYQSQQSNYNIGPNMAIMDFLEKNPKKFRQISTNLGLPGMTLLFRQL